MDDDWRKNQATTLDGPRGSSLRDDEAQIFNRLEGDTSLRDLTIVCGNSKVQGESRIRHERQRIQLANFVQVHKDMLMINSPYFARLFKNDHLEVLTGEVKLRDVDPETIKIMIDWMYSGYWYHLDTDHSYNEDAHRLIKLFVFADRYEMNWLSMAASHNFGLCIKLNKEWSVEELVNIVETVYDCTKQNSMLCHRLVEEFFDTKLKALLATKGLRDDLQKKPEFLYAMLLNICFGKIACREDET